MKHQFLFKVFLTLAVTSLISFSVVSAQTEEGQPAVEVNTTLSSEIVNVNTVGPESEPVSEIVTVSAEPTDTASVVVEPVTDPAPATEPVIEVVEPTVTEQPIIETPAVNQPVESSETESVTIAPEISAPTTIVQPELTTDKADYAPGETVTIFGKFFAALQQIILNIFGGSTDDGTYVESNQSVVTDDQGSFITTYILDNIFRPLYTVIAKTLTGDTLAETTFTDPYTGGGNLDEFSQCANDDGDGYTGTDLGCHWTNGDLNGSNSTYYEDDATVQRLAIKDLINGDHYAIIKYSTTKGGKHSYDFMTDDDYSELALNPLTPEDLCDPAITNLASCASSPALPSGLIPTDPNADGKDVLRSNRHFKIRNGTWVTGTPTGADGIQSGPTLLDGTYAGDSDTIITIKFHVDTSTCANKYTKQGTDVCEVLITWGAHVSSQADWGPGSSAVNINGSPYHVQLANIDNPATTGGGNDNQMSATAVIVPQQATLTLLKTVTNDNGGAALDTAWTLSASGPTPISGVEGDAVVTAALVDAGDYTLSESGGPSGYTATLYSCVVNGGSPVVSNSLTLAASDVAVCTITNDDIAPKLHLRKVVVNDNGGTAADTDWALTADGSGLNDISGSTPVDSTGTFIADTFALSETGPSGYTASSWVCVGGTQSGSNITVSIGGETTCTITNNDIQSKLTVTKVVQNNYDGKATVSSFTLYVNSTQVTSGIQNGFNAGSYTVSEGALPTGYEKVGITGDCGLDGSITLALGDVKSCTITNRDIQPKLTLIKTVINDNGGSKQVADFLLYVDTTAVVSGVKNGFNAGTYTASETSPTGYTASTWGGACAANGSVTLVVGDDKTCTITNDDIAPQLTIIKHVINDNGGTATAGNWTMDVVATNPSNNHFTGQEAPGVTITLDAGSYDVDESGGPSGYSKSLSVDCSGTIAIGQTKTCTITNDDIAPTLTLFKTVVNNNGGTAVYTDFQARLDGNPVSWGLQTVNAGTYTASEDQLTGYSASVWGTNCAANGTVTLGVGENKTCTITNDDQPGHLIVHKVTNPAADSNIFSITINTTPIDGGATRDLSTSADVNYEVNAGSYSVTEAAEAGWDETGNTCVNVAVVNGGTNECTITNTKRGHLIVQKTTQPSGDQTVFTINATGTNAIIGSESGTITDASDKDYEVKPGTFSVTETVPAGWDKTGDTCQEVVVAAGETKYCEITNTKRGHIKIQKDAIPDGSQEFTFNNNFSNGNPEIFGLTDLPGGGLASSTFEVLPGKYAVSEDSVTGWKQDSATCDSGETIGDIDVNPGETVTCTFTNQKLATIILVKHAIGGDETFNFTTTGGDGLPASPSLITSGGRATSTFSNIDPDITYSISETIPAGWDLTSATCTGTNTPDDITPNAGEIITCTFTNTKRGKIIIDKITNPTQSSQEFTFTPSYGSNFVLTDQAAPNESGWLVPGTYSVSEGAVTNWTNTSATCDDNSPINAINLGAGKIVTCTFENTYTPPLTVTKTAATTYTRTFGWTIDKSVSPSTWDMFKGDSGTSQYTVGVAKDQGTDSGWHATGTITIHNSAAVAAHITDVSDVITPAINATVECPVTLPYDLAAGADLTCTYSENLPNADSRTNTATVTTTGLVPGSSGNANVTFGEPTTLVNNTINVNDTNGGSWPFSDSGSVNYDKTFTCDADQGTHNNTATIQETGQNDSATVTVGCYTLGASKDANTSFDRTYGWTIDKTANQTNLTLSPDQVFPVNYGVTVNTTGSLDSNWAVNGTITIHNPAPIAATINGVTDAISGVGATTVDCGSITFPYTLAASGDLSCTYSSTLPNADSRTNTATVTLQNSPSGTTDFSGTANITFASAIRTDIDECINVNDTLQGTLGTVCINETLPKTYNYTRQIGPYAIEACGLPQSVNNTASLTTNDSGSTQNDSWVVNVNVACVCSLTQGYWKTHNNSFKGGAPTDNTWNLLLGGSAENTSFFLSGQSWFTVFWSAPKGNAYYNLAHQYMAAKLNILNGAWGPTVLADLATAESLFNLYTPAQIAALKNKPTDKALKQQFIDLAGKLGAFNEGLTNPAGHCSEIPVP